jgi:hypothetical protein
MPDLFPLGLTFFICHEPECVDWWQLACGHRLPYLASEKSFPKINQTKIGDNQCRNLLKHKTTLFCERCLYYSIKDLSTILEAIQITLN